MSHKLDISARSGLCMKRIMSSVSRTKGSAVHPMTQRAISKLGRDIALARRARRISAEEFAERAGISRATLYRLEHGDAGVSLNTLAMVLHVLGRMDLLSNLLDASVDDVGLMMMRGQVPKRIAKTKAKPSTQKRNENPSTGIMEW